MALSTLRRAVVLAVFASLAVVVSATGMASSDANPKLVPGAAGIVKKPRKLPQLPAVTINDSYAMFRTRPKGEDRTGVTKNEILLGQHTALSGPLAYLGIGFSDGADAIFNQVNAAGGIFGRKIRLIIGDDHFDPATTVQVVRRLVEGKHVFAMFNGLGSSPHKAVFQYLIDHHVPDMFPGVGDSYVGYPVHPTVFSGYLNTSVDVASVAAAACQTKNAKLAVIYEDDLAGQAGLQGVKVSAKKYSSNGCSIASSVSFSTSSSDLTPYVEQAVQGTGATELVVVAFTPQQSGPIVKALRDTLGSKMPVFLTAGSAQVATAQLAGGNNLNGAISDIFFKQATQTSLPVIQQLSAYYTRHHISFNNNSVVGAMWALDMVHALELAGPDLTRQGLLQAMTYGFNGKWACEVCVGPTTYSSTDHWTIKSLGLVRYDAAKQAFVPYGKPVTFTASDIDAIVG